MRFPCRRTHSDFLFPHCCYFREVIVHTENTGLHPKRIVSAYGDLLALIGEQDKPEPLKLLPSALPESMLPFPQTTIRHALAIYLLHQDYIEEREIIEDAYTFLDNFIPDEEYSIFRALQSSMETRGRLESRDKDLSYTLMLLKARTGVIKKRRKQSAQELKSLRRIIGLPVKKSPYNEEGTEEIPELELNL